MPTYEYECEAGHSFEKVQRMSEDALDKCEICEAPAQRLISASSFILKGSGWFASDYSNAAKPEEAGKRAADSTSSSSSDSDS